MIIDSRAVIYQEAYTGTKLYERKELEKLLKKLQPDAGDVRSESLRYFGGYISMG